MMMRRLAVLLTAALFAGVAQAQVITVTTQNDRELDVVYTKSTVRKAGVILDTGEWLDFAQIKKISTDHFDAYERAVLRTARKENEHVEVVFTGDENLFALCCSACSPVIGA